jgi:hypothetical protein
MPWEVVKQGDKFNRRNEPFISISSARVCFSAPFVRIADIDDHHRVTVFTDAKTLNLGFEFHTEERPYSFRLAFDPKNSNKKTGLICCSQGIVNSFKWISGVTKLPPVYRRFPPKKEGKLWVVTLCPSFENSYARESADIPKNDKGIYRYVRRNGKIVYIGRGDVYRRMRAVDRASWDFDTIEYTCIDDEKQRIHWEGYWLRKFTESEGVLPFYNKIYGFDSDK